MLCIGCLFDNLSLLSTGLVKKTDGGENRFWEEMAELMGIDGVNIGKRGLTLRIGPHFELGP